MEHIPALVLIPCGQRIKVLIAESLFHAIMRMAANDYIVTLLEAIHNRILRKPEARRVLSIYYPFAFENKFFRKIIFNRARQNFIKKAVQRPHPIFIFLEFYVPGAQQMAMREKYIFIIKPDGGLLAEKNNPKCRQNLLIKEQITVANQYINP